jgi:serine/threonine-protein kinase HipA
MTQRLEVFINSERVGTLFDEHNIWAFQYSPEWLGSAHRFPLSPALPLGPNLLQDGGTHRPTQWFFDNLLPEETLREVLAKEENIAQADAFGLLQRLGSESAGAIVLRAPGEPEAPTGAQALSPDALSARIQKLPVASLHKDAPKRMSLAGAQHKMVVLFDPDTSRLFEPLKGSPSTHILKPNSTAPGYPHSVVNETFTMRLAARMGLAVPKVWRLYVPEPTYIIERFDRSPPQDAAPPQRLHVLDGCQMLSLHAAYKYTHATFPTLRALIGLCRNKAATRMAMFRWMLFNTLVGNSDCHLKNISFFMAHDGCRIAPFYDLVCTAAYHTRLYADEQAVWPKERLAMPVADAGHFEDVSFDKLVQTGAELGLAKGTAEREVATFLKTLPTACDALMDTLLAEYANHPMTAHATPETRAAESQLLRTIRHVVIADMLRLASRAG